MKVLLNIDSLAPPLTGLGTYTFHLANQLERHSGVASLALFSKNGLTSKTIVPAVFRKALRRVPYSYELRDRVSGYLLRRARFAQRDYVYHEPNYIPAPYDGALVVTVSDLSHHHFPHYHPRERVKWLDQNLDRSVRDACQVICHSNFVRDEVAAVYGIPLEKINVVYCGVSDVFRPHSADEIRPILSKYGLDRPGYLLSVGTMEPRKNLVGLITAYSLLPSSLRRSFPLVLVGAQGWLTERIEQAMAPLIQEGSLRRLGYVPIDDLPAVYAGAHAFAYLSFYEGFGLPLIEAMASGLPLISSNRSALPETAGPAGILVNPDDTDDIVQGLQRLLLDDELRKEAVAAGLQRAKQFSWESAVDETVRVYRKALRGPSP